MNEYNSINDTFYNILKESKYETITNKFCVWKDGERFIIEDMSKSESHWQLVFNCYTVRALALLRKHNLLYSTRYKIKVSQDSLILKTHGHPWTNFMAPHHKIIWSVIRQIQLLLFCKIKVYEYKEDDQEITSIWIFPYRTINGLSLGLCNFASKILQQVVDFAQSDNIRIIPTQDEEEFFLNPIVREKLSWESFLFNYHNGVCFIIHQNYSNIMNGNKGYITKTPEYPPHIAEDYKSSDSYYSSDRDYIHFKLFVEWQDAIKTYLEEKKQRDDYYYQSNKVEIDKGIEEFNKLKNRQPSFSEWEEIDENPYYRWDIGDDEQSIEFWNSI